MKQREAWAQFIGFMERAEREGGDGCVPVAVILLPAEGDAEKGMSVDLNGAPRLIWPATFPIEERAPLTARVAEAYIKRAVKR